MDAGIALFVFPLLFLMCGLVLRASWKIGHENESEQERQRRRRRCAAAGRSCLIGQNLAAW